MTRSSPVRWTAIAIPALGGATAVEGIGQTIRLCLRLRYGDEEVRKMISLNAARLIGLEDA